MIDELKIKEILAETVEVDISEIVDSTELYKLPNFDSVELLTLIVALDDNGFSVNQGKASTIRTFADLMNLVQKSE